MGFVYCDFCSLLYMRRKAGFVKIFFYSPRLAEFLNCQNEGS